MPTRHELLEVLRPRYREATRVEKSRILDELVAISGYHRKHAVRLLNQPAVEGGSDRKAEKIYNEAVRQALVILWEASDRICGKRLKAMLPLLIESMDRHGHLSLDHEVRERLLAVSPATIDRMLATVREGAGRRRQRPLSSTSVRRRVPVRTFADWGDPVPGYFEADFVAHGGGSPAGRFLHTFVVTDIASGWTEGIPMLVRQQHLVVEALKLFRARLPVPLLGFDTDNDGAFINETVIDFCASEGIEFTRSRPYRKNDQAWVEQKNGSIVRRMVGYDRIEGIAAGRRLGRLLEAARLYVNFFQPSFKLREKKRLGAKVIKKYFKPATPCDRLLGNPRVAESIKIRLREQRAVLDPVALLKTIRDSQAELAAGEDVPYETEPDAASFVEFLAALPDLWKHGEVRSTHKKKPRPPRTWRTRADPFERAWPEVLGWLAAEPDTTAKDLFARLQAQCPGEFQDGQLRTLQRRVSTWRAQRASELVHTLSAAEPADLGARNRLPAARP